MNPPTTAFVGLGANLDDAQASVRAAAARLGELPETACLALSRLYRTPAWGLEAQPDFVNAVAMLRTGLEPLALLERLLAIEREFGRDRSREQRWGPRRLDLDLLLYGDRVLDVPGLQLPHPRLHERAFALVPLLEVAPDAWIPGHGYARDAASGLERSNIQPL
ncbi:2-amino-4-hydroxy-6-hydroxymethyldihydropteridine diphosphokinase [Pseudoxanthomonas beigongshangi]